MDAVLRGRLLVRGAFVTGEIGIEDGAIVRVGRRLRAESVIDVGSNLILPAALDLHVHFRDPGHPTKEDFGSGTLAAAHGGVTCALDMPNTSPPTTSLAAFEAKREEASRKAHVDFGLYAGLTSDPKSARLLRAATALKGYLGASTGDLLVENPASIRAALVEQARTGKLVAFHAESEACLATHRASLAHRSDPAAWAEARPASCEADAIGAVRKLLPPKARAHIAHLSSAAGLKALGRSRLSSEVTPHHLFATTDDLAKDGRWKMNPPLRSKRDVAALWSALRSGAIDAVASDHAPHLPEEKARGVWEAPAGVPGVETLLPLLLAAWRARRISLPRVVAALATNPARLAGVRKGRIARGYDADLVVVDPRRVERIRASRLHSRCGWTPYEGREGVFPTDVFLRGERIVRDGVFEGRAGAGRFVPGGAPR